MKLQATHFLKNSKKVLKYVKKKLLEDLRKGLKNQKIEKIFISFKNLNNYFEKFQNRRNELKIIFWNLEKI